MSKSTCKDGLLIPALEVTHRNSVFYLMALLYCFLGIAIVADIFMCSIERITSAKRKVKRPKNKSEQREVMRNASSEDTEYEEVRIWNPTVANLTLMALGSSAPEILLSTIEIVGNGFKAGELGPGTIVGSAAFNLFCISAICVMAVKSPETKRIAIFNVFIVTAFFGTFAYIWLLIILSLISPNIVEVWEAAATLFLFFVLVVMAYGVDIQGKKATLQEFEMVDEKRPIRLELSSSKYAQHHTIEDGNLGMAPSFETVRTLSRNMARAYPTLSLEEHAKILAYRLNQKVTRDRLFYRIKAIRWLTSSLRRTDMEREVEDTLNRASYDDGLTQSDGQVKPQIEFSARVYAIDPSDKSVTLTIIRRGSCHDAITVNYSTVNGVAKRDLHFLPKTETIKFLPSERKKNITIELVDGANWRPNNVFYVNLKIEDQEKNDKTSLGQCNVARVRYPDDSASLMGEPAVEFVKANYVAKENCGWVRVFVSRRGKKHSGETTVFYETLNITAQETFDYMPVKNGKLQFEGQEYEKYIDIEIIDDKQDEKDETFSIELLKTSDEEVSFARNRRTTVTIISDDNVLKNITNVRKLMGYYMRAMTPGQTTWLEQIRSAVSVNAGDTNNASLSDCIIHGIAFPWKFVFAFVPPPSLLGGWPCFIVALISIGVITAVVGDLASIFGCMVGLKDAVTAITLVALGTSLPDTFASKIAAENIYCLYFLDESADNAVGNVTGSNSVNVFLGLGLPWFFASVYWTLKGKSFQVEAGDLGFSVTVFMCFSILFLLVLILRRTSVYFGRAELGGFTTPKIASGLFFIILWICYVALSIWKTYSH